MTRFCSNCGTEVDDDAAFCPSCGRPIDAADRENRDDQTATIPPAPGWPASESPATADDDQAAGVDGSTAADDERGRPLDDAPPRPSGTADRAEPGAAPPPPRADERAAGQPPRPGRPAPRSVSPLPPRDGRGDGSQGQQMDLPITWPVTMSGWLVGGGAVLAALGFVVELFPGRADSGNAMNLIFLVLLLGVVATIFLSASVPAIPHLRLATLCLSFAAFGVALDRLGFGIAGVGTMLVLIGAAAACVGAVILELGRDRPMSGPVGGGR